MAIINCNNSEKIFLSEGSFLIAIGLITIYLSQATQLTFTMLFSLGLFFVGLYKVINAIITRHNLVMPFLSIISALFLIVTGMYLMFNPIFDTLFLVIGTIMYLFMDSLVSFAAAAESSGRKQVFWIGIFTGLVQLALAVAVFYSAPFYALWISGLALGIDFVFSGILYITKYSYARKLAYCTC